MRNLLTVALLCGLLPGTLWVMSMHASSEAAEPAGPRLAHTVFFTLKDNSPDARKKLVAACAKYLAKHPGTVSFAVGTRAEELNRPVNDHDFDVSLYLVFENRKAHDQYQAAPLHKQFIEENEPTWKQVRVFDSLLE